MRRIIVHLVTALFMLATGTAHGMDFSIKSISEKVNVVYAQGQIVKGDVDKFLEIIKTDRIDKPFLVIKSLGGNVAAAFELARAIKAHGFSVVVNEECASACAMIIFPAGERSVALEGSMLGFHSCYNANDQKVALWCNEEIAKFAVENGFPYGAIRSFMDAFGPTEMRWITEITATCFGYYRDFRDPPKPLFGKKPCVDAIIIALRDRARSPVGPSFNCDKASTNVERLICNDKELMLVDAIMGELYRHVRKLLPLESSKNFRSKQKNWILKRNEICAPLINTLDSFRATRKGANCLSERNQERIIWMINEFQLMSVVVPENRKAE